MSLTSVSFSAFSFGSVQGQATRALSRTNSSTSNRVARSTARIPMQSTVHAESPFFSSDMSFLVLPLYCPRKSWGGGQFVQSPLVLRCNWTAFQIFQELGMVPNFQIVQIIEYIHRTLHLRTAAQNDRN